MVSTSVRVRRPLHRAGGNHRLGLALALGTAFLWGFLSIALKVLVEGMDVYTITWYRLTTAAVLLGAYQAHRRRLPDISLLGRGGWALLAVALVGLLGNYVLFLVALDYVPPATAQLVIQLAPILFLLGGLAIFQERFSRWQWAGLAVLIVGLLLFFNQRLPALLRLSGTEALGVLIVVVSGTVWAGYALAQKQLLATFSSVNILLLIYIGSTAALFPLAEPSQILELTTVEWWLLLFCIFNTLAAYGCFAEALQHWEASRVSAVIALSPLVTIAAVPALLVFWPHLDIGEPLDALALLGALIVVAGSMMTALGRREKAPEPLALD